MNNNVRRWNWDKRNQLGSVSLNIQIHWSYVFVLAKRRLIWDNYSWLSIIVIFQIDQQALCSIQHLNTAFPLWFLVSSKRSFFQHNSKTLGLRVGKRSPFLFPFLSITRHCTWIVVCNLLINWFEWRFEGVTFSNLCEMICLPRFYHYMLFCIKFVSSSKNEAVCDKVSVKCILWTYYSFGKLKINWSCRCKMIFFTAHNTTC